MNYHFTTTKAHFELAGATVLEIYTDEALNTQSTQPVQGQPGSAASSRTAIKKYGAEQDPVRPHGSDHQPRSAASRSRCTTCAR